MRTKLQEKDGERLRFQGTVDRFSIKSGWEGRLDETICLVDVSFVNADGTISKAADHIWLTVGKTMGNLNLEVGDTLQFNARIGPYEKGYVNHREGIDERTTDYRLNRPTKLVKL